MTLGTMNLMSSGANEASTWVLLKVKVTVKSLSHVRLFATP